MSPETTLTAGEPACAQTARAGVHMLLPTAPTHSPLIPPSWGWERGPCRRGSHSRWVAEVGERLQGTAWGCALRAAGTALPVTRHRLDFFLCWDTLPSPGPSRLGNSLISLIPASPGAKPPPGPPRQGYHTRTWQAQDPWAPVVRDAHLVVPCYQGSWAQPGAQKAPQTPVHNHRAGSS